MVRRRVLYTGPCGIQARIEYAAHFGEQDTPLVVATESVSQLFYSGTI